MDERRSIGRTKIAKGALLFFSGQPGVRSCGVTDITNLGAGIRTQGLAVLPLNFELSFDNFHTVRKCRLIWRAGEALGVMFENQNTRSRGETSVSEIGGVPPEPVFLSLNDPPPPTDPGNAAGSSGDTSKIPERKNQRGADLRFTLGVAIALALPALLGMGVYLAGTAILRAI
jgi:hypothetical protein